MGNRVGGDFGDDRIRASCVCVSYTVFYARGPQHDGSLALRNFWELDVLVGFRVPYVSILDAQRGTAPVGLCPTVPTARPHDAVTVRQGQSESGGGGCRNLASRTVKRRPAMGIGVGSMGTGRATSGMGIRWK